MRLKWEPGADSGRQVGVTGGLVSAAQPAEEEEERRGEKKRGEQRVEEKEREERRREEKITESIPDNSI